MKKVMKVFCEKIAFPLRWRYLVRHLSPHLKKSKKVLDLGASCGRVANELSKKNNNINFEGVDIHVQEKTFIPIKKYDGRNIPYPDNSFDCVMIIDVLHHDTDPEKIIQEAKRVSKKYILIKDHYWKTKLDFKLLKYADYIGNAPYGVSLPYNYLKVSDWKKIFENLELEIKKSKLFRYNFLDPCKHAIYLLEK